ncbi:MAG: nucleotidyltransferase family protein [Woeseiaceae bacterium]
MQRLDDYRAAMLAVFSETPDEVLEDNLQQRGSNFVSFVVDYGLGPLWHVRTGLDEFRESRMVSESLFLVHVDALKHIDTVLGSADIPYVVIKGAANRLLLYDNPAVRACHDIDLLVHPDDRVRAANALIEYGYSSAPKPQNISHQLELTSGAVTIDLHWGLLREGRLRTQPVADMLARRRRVGDVWVLDATDTLFLLLVHPAFAKHLGAWDMGLHRVADIADWLREFDANWPEVCRILELNGVSTAAWATLRWLQLLAPASMSQQLEKLMADVRPGPLRRAYLDYWLENNLSARTSGVHIIRLLGFSIFMHDRPSDALRAFRGRSRAHRRQAEDLAAFSA